MPDPVRGDEGRWGELVPQVLARLLRMYGSQQFDLCEDAVQDALLEAYRHPAGWRPDDALAWLVTVARRRYVDRVRADASRREREEKAARLQAPLESPGTRTAGDGQADDVVQLLLLCAHPGLPKQMQVALALRAVAGLSTRQIAAVYQLPESTIAQRISRAKRRIVDLGQGFPAPSGARERLVPVLDVLYVMFTEAHHTSGGASARDATLAQEAVRLARLLSRAVPESTEAAGLLALMLLGESRAPARVDALGRFVPLDEQNRALWDRALLREGLAVLERAVPGAEPGPYLLQACIAGVHAQAEEAASTDWQEIHALYTVLEHLTASKNPTVTLNRIVAQAMLQGEEDALDALDGLQRLHPRLARLESVRAHLLERAGRPADAAAAYRRAIAETLNSAEQGYLRERLRRLPDLPDGRP